MAKISVITPVYDCAKFLEKFLFTILNQSFKDFELICINDGSKDESLNILRKYEERDQRMIVIDKDNTGAGHSRNIGIEKSIGDYLIFLDSDDFFELDMLEKMYQRAIDTNAEIVIMNSNTYLHNRQIYVSNNNVNNMKYLKMHKDNYLSDKKMIFTSSNGWAWDKLFKRSFVIKQGLKFQEIRSSNDLYFTYGLMSLSNSIVFCDSIGVHQRRNVSTSLSSTNHKSWDCCFIALRELYKLLCTTKRIDIYYHSYISFAVKFLSWNLLKYPYESRKKLFALLTQNLKNLGLVNITKKIINKNERIYFSAFKYLLSQDFIKFSKRVAFINFRINVYKYRKKILMF